MQLMWAFFTFAKIWFSYDADDLCSCIVLSYRFLKCNKKKEKKKFVVFNAMPFSISEVKDKQCPGTDAIRTKVLPSKLMWEITKVIMSKYKENIIMVNQMQKVATQLPQPS